jgi:hypothetical protein
MGVEKLMERLSAAKNGPLSGKRSERRAPLSICPLMTRSGLRVVNCIQISILQERTLLQFEPSAQSGRAFNPTF